MGLVLQIPFLHMFSDYPWFISPDLKLRRQRRGIHSNNKLSLHFTQELFGADFNGLE